MTPTEMAFAKAARGFMPDAEGLALWQAASDAIDGPMLEVGSYCGKSACYIGPAARQKAQCSIVLIITGDQKRTSPAGSITSPIWLILP